MTTYISREDVMQILEWEINNLEWTTLLKKITSLPSIPIEQYNSQIIELIEKKIERYRKLSEEPKYTNDANDRIFFLKELLSEIKSL